MITFLKRNYLWIILLGSLIGLNETLIGGIKIPYLVNYIFARGSMTAVASSAISVFVLYLIRHFKYDYFARLNPRFISGLLGFVIIALWMSGFYST